MFRKLGYLRSWSVHRPLSYIASVPRFSIIWYHLARYMLWFHLARHIMKIRCPNLPINRLQINRLQINRFQGSTGDTVNWVFHTNSRCTKYIGTLSALRILWICSPTPEELQAVFRRKFSKFFEPKILLINSLLLHEFDHIKK